MKIAILSSHPIQYQAPLFRRLAATPGVELTVLFCHDHGVAPSLDREFGAVFQYDVPLLEGYASRFLRNVARSPSLSPTGMVNPEMSRLLARGAFDALVVHGYASVTNLLALASPRRRTRVLLRGESNLLFARPWSKRLVKQVALRALFSRVDHFVSIGTLNTAYYRAYGVADERITVAPYTVDNDFFESRSVEARRDPAAARRALGITEDSILLLFSGKLIPKKRPLDALHALARLPSTHRLELAFVGDGELRERIAQEAQELGVSHRVHFLGFRNQTELPAIYGAADILILPSDYEPWGLVVNEAMACGLVPVVSDQVGAAPDLVPPAQVFPAGNVNALTQSIQTLLSDRNRLVAEKRAASSRISRWSLNETAAGFLRAVDAAVRFPAH